MAKTAKADRRKAAPAPTLDREVYLPQTGERLMVDGSLDIMFTGGVRPGMVGGRMQIERVTVVVNGKVEFFADDLVSAIIYGYKRLVGADPWSDLDTEDDLNG
jgi:hypothetical protein